MMSTQLEPGTYTPRKRHRGPGGGFLLVCAVYGLLGLAALWVARVPGPERIWQSWHQLRSGRITSLSREDLRRWREALGRHPELAQTLNPAPLSIVSPHRAGLVEAGSVWLLHSSPQATPLRLSLDGESLPAALSLRGYAKPGTGPDWERQARLRPGQSLNLSLPAAGPELIEIRFERRLRARLELGGPERSSP